MKPRRNVISYNSTELFRLNVEEYSRFRFWIASTLDTLLCVPFGHRFIWQFSLCNALWKWESANTKTVASLPIDRSTADTLSKDKEAWSWLDEDDSEA